MPELHHLYFLIPVILFFVFKSKYNGYTKASPTPKKLTFNSYLFNHKHNLKSANNVLPIWGSYNPGYYFSLKQKTPPPYILTGIMWTTEELLARSRIRHMVAQDELESFSWIRHDGMRYGRHHYKDPQGSLQFNATFATSSSSSSLDNSQQIPTNGWDWVQRFDLHPTGAGEGAGSGAGAGSSLFSYYFGIDCDGFYADEECFKRSEFRIHKIIERGPLTTKDDPSNSSSSSSSSSSKVMIKSYLVFGQSKKEKMFCMEYNLYTNSLDSHTESNPPIVSFYSDPKKTSASNMIDRLKPIMMGHRSRSYQGKRTESESQSEYDQNLDFTSSTTTTSAGSSFDKGSVVFQIRSKMKCSLDVVFHSNLFVNSFEELEKKVIHTSSDDIETAFKELELKFEDKYESIFGNESISSSTTTTTTTTGSTDDHGFDNEDKELNKRILSNILGGIGYFYGVPSIENVSLSEIEPIELVTATPSRTSFPRGFLWDEGFHQMIIHRWDEDITMNVISHWMSAMYFVGKNSGRYFKGGWIPREMILGRESNRRVPGEFITQKETIANPPTLLLTIEAMLDSNFNSNSNQQCISENDESSCTTSNVKQNKILNFIHKIFPALHSWIFWLLSSQIVTPNNKRSVLPYPGGPATIAFAWRGRNIYERKLNPNTLASGLDDYPRAMLPCDEEMHADLMSWVIKSCDIMSKLQTLLIQHSLIDEAMIQTIQSDLSSLTSINTGGFEGKAWTYSTLSAYLKGQLDRIHWSEPLKGYYDIGAHDNNYEIVTEVLVRCASPKDNTYVDTGVTVELFNERKITCPASHPQFVYPLQDSSTGRLAIQQRVHTSLRSLSLQHVFHIGYSALFPLLLTILEPNSPRLSDILTQIQSPDHLWTEFGLRSLSTKDSFYRVGNAPGDEPYWRGPIWINVNYLALKALRFYSLTPGHEQNRCHTIYTDLRNNLIKNVFAELKKTGDLWEHYDDLTGKGTRGHPFNGWSALIFNIRHEIY